MAQTTASQKVHALDISVCDNCYNSTDEPSMYVHVQAIIIRATLNRWLKKWGLTMANEKRQRELAQQWSPDCVQAECVPFSFHLSNGGEEM